MHDRDNTASWIGASLLRKEDARHLHGRGMFIADINMPGTQEIAFVRSQRAHANMRQVTKPSELGARVFTLADIGQINILEAGPELAAHRHSPYPPLADRRVRSAYGASCGSIGRRPFHSKDGAFSLTGTIGSTN